MFGCSQLSAMFSKMAGVADTLVTQLTGLHEGLFNVGPYLSIFIVSSGAL